MLFLTLPTIASYTTIFGDSINVIQVSVHLPTPNIFQPPKSWTMNKVLLGRSYHVWNRIEGFSLLFIVLMLDLEATECT